MNVPNVRKWVKALRSGKYKQAKYVLHDGEGYCCLGVVCVLAGMKPKFRKGQHHFGQSTCILPTQAKRWLGIKDDDPIIGRRSATTLNDDDNLRLKTIANRIEKDWLNGRVK